VGGSLGVSQYDTGVAVCRALAPPSGVVFRLGPLPPMPGRYNVHVLSRIPNSWILPNLDAHTTNFISTCKIVSSAPKKNNCPKSDTEFYGGTFFFPCTRHVSMYLRSGIVRGFSPECWKGELRGGHFCPSVCRRLLIFIVSPK
jgi:hypothetical protein